MKLLGVSGGRAGYVRLCFGGHGLGDGAGRAHRLGRRRRGRTHGIAGPAGGSDRKPVGTVVFARAERDADPVKIVADTKAFGDLAAAASGFRRRSARLTFCSPTSLPRPIKRARPFFEGADHPPQRAIEHLPGERFEQAIAEAEIDAEIDFSTSALRGELPTIVEIFERPFDIVDLDLKGPGVFLTFEVKVSLSALKPTTRSATISVSSSWRIRVAATQGRNSW